VGGARRGSGEAVLQCGSLAKTSWMMDCGEIHKLGDHSSKSSKRIPTSTLFDPLPSAPKSHS